MTIVDRAYLWLIQSLHLYIWVLVLAHSWFTHSTRILVIGLIKVYCIIGIIFCLFLDQLKVIVAECSLRARGCFTSIPIIKATIFITDGLDHLVFVHIDLLTRRSLIYLRWSFKNALAVLISKHRLHGNVTLVNAHGIRSCLLHCMIWLKIALSLSHTSVKGRIVHFRLLWFSIDFRRWR